MLNLHKQHIEHVLYSVWNEFSPDHDKIDLWAVPNVEYLPVEGGVMILHRHQGINEIHAAFLPEYRGFTSINEAKKALLYFAEKYGEIIAKIDIKRTNVIWFAEATGMIKTHQDNDNQYLRYF